MSVLARNAISRLRVKYAWSSVSRTCSISGRMSCEARRFRGGALQQRPGSLRHQAGLGEQTDDGVKRLGDGSARGRRLQSEPGQA